MCLPNCRAFIKHGWSYLLEMNVCTTELMIGNHVTVIVTVAVVVVAPFGFAHHRWRLKCQK